MKKNIFSVFAILAFCVSGFANNEVTKETNKPTIYDCCVATLYYNGQRVDSVERCFQGSFDNNCKKAEADLLDRNPDAKKVIKETNSLQL